MHERNFGSYEDDDDDFLSKEVSRLSGVKRLGEEGEVKGRGEGELGTIMQSKSCLFR